MGVIQSLLFGTERHSKQNIEPLKVKHIRHTLSSHLSAVLAVILESMSDPFTVSFFVETNSKNCFSKLQRYIA